MIDNQGRVKATLREGDCCGEVALLQSEPRNAPVRATPPCRLFVLERANFNRILRDHLRFAKTIREIASTRYNKTFSEEHLIATYSKFGTSYEF